METHIEGTNYGDSFRLQGMETRIEATMHGDS